MDNETTVEIKRYLDVSIAGLRQEVRADIDTAVAGLRVDLKADIRDVRLHTDVVAEELRVEIRDVKRHTDVVAESLRSEIRLVAEGVAGLDEKFTQEFINVRAEMREQIGDVKVLLRAGYGDLDRRVTALEKKPS